MHTRLLSNNLAATADTQPGHWCGGELTPGIGTADLKVGLPIAKVEGLLGEPDQKLASGDQFFYIYRSRGLDVDFGKSQRGVKRLFFYDVAVEGHTRAPSVRVHGIGFGSSRKGVLEVFGKPDLEGGPVRVGNRKKSWICYHSGLQFDFDRHDRVRIIVVFDRRLLRTV
jgi:hypothetical protein